MKKTLVVILLSIYSFTTFGQTSYYPQNYFGLPINIPLSASGIFAELRNNHFHSGIDFRTNARIGLPVYSVAEGYVSRIKISAWGGGKTLYIDHPNGYRSVYMHLHCFEGDIAKYVEEYQYNKQIFEFDINVDSDRLTVSKGQLIAKSGNTGSSGGPHLHFEIRDAMNDRTINPLLFGYTIQDNVAPIIEKVRIYPANKASFVNNRNQVFAKTNSQASSKQKKQLGNDTIPVWGKVYFGIKTFDKLYNSAGRLGVHKIELLIDDEIVYDVCIQDFLFENTRYINAFTDYGYYQKNKEFFILTKLPSFTPMPIYQKIKNKGIYDFTDEKKHKIHYRVSDYVGNISNWVFYLKSVRPINTSQEKAVNMEEPDFLFSQSNTFEHSSFRIVLEEKTLYESIKFKYKINPQKGRNVISNWYTIQDENVPVHKPFKLSIMPYNFPEYLKSKAVIIRAANKKDTICEGGVWEGNMLTAFAKNFGNFAISIDTVAPVIRSSNFTDSSFLKPNQTSLLLKISDNLSGITSYNCFLNGNWILGEYDGKTNSLAISINNKNLLKANTLNVSVKDACSNEAVLNYTIYKR